MNGKIKSIAEQFGSSEEPILLPGGEGKTYRTGNIIIKPILDKNESEEISEIADSLRLSKKIRLPRPVKSIKGNWIEEDFVAWTYIEGEEAKERYEEKIEVCDSFNEVFRAVSKPRFIEMRSNPWVIADRVTWNELEIKYEGNFQSIITKVQSFLKPVNLPYQIIHGDITGNIIFSKSKVPGVIDITLYWRPADYASALLVVDAITWEGGNTDLYDLVKDLPEIDQLLLRAGLRRIIEQPEHIKYFGKDRDKAEEEANKYLETLKKLDLV